MDRNSKGGFRKVKKNHYSLHKIPNRFFFLTVILIEMLHCFVYRTDNAVKNRFSTLCKKRAKYEALAKENNISYTNSNNKRVIFRDAASDSAVDYKKMRYVKL